MYSSLSSVRNALRSSSLISQLARNHVNLKPSRPFSAFPPIYDCIYFPSSSLFSLLSRNHGDLRALRPVSTVPEKCESSEDGFTDLDQNRICDEDTGPKPYRISEDSTSHLISVLTMQRSKSRWGHLQSLRPKGFDPEEFSEIVIAIRNNSHLALRFFRWTQNKSLCNHNTSSYSTIIHILARGRLKHQARLIICEAIRVSGKDDLKPDLKPLKVFESLAKTYKRCDSAPFVFDLLIEACLDSKKFKPAIRIVRMLLSRNISPSYGTCNSLLRQVSRFVGADEGYDLYKAIFGLKKSRVRPSIVILNTLMIAFYQESALERVENIWDEIIQSGCEPNCFSFSILMAAYCDEGKINKAEEVWEKMKASKVEFDIVAYNTMIGGFCQAGELEKAEEYFREMGLRGIESSSTTYEHLIKGYCKVGHLDSAMLIYKDIDNIGFSPEALTIDTLIRALCFGDRVSEALDVSKCAKGSVGFSPARESFEVLIASLCREGKTEEALKLQAEMVAGGFEPSREIYGAFISSYEEQGNVEMALKLRKEMLESGM